MNIDDVRGLPIDLSDRVAIVTGAAGGIGAAVVRMFLTTGAAVLATDVDADAGKALLDELDAGDQLEFVAADVTQEDQSPASSTRRSSASGGSTSPTTTWASTARSRRSTSTRPTTGTASWRST